MHNVPQPIKSRVRPSTIDTARFVTGLTQGARFEVDYKYVDVIHEHFSGFGEVSAWVSVADLRLARVRSKYALR